MPNLRLYRYRSFLRWLGGVFLQASFVFTPLSVASSGSGNDPEWKTLLHYRTQSEADGEAFFLDPQGNKNPEAELAATLHAFHTHRTVTHQAGEMPAECAFPARLRWLKTRNLIPKDTPDSLSNPKCDALITWWKRLDAKDLSLIYAAPYLGSPASMFGHTFLKINTHRQSDLLSYALNFEAYTGVDAGFGYIFNGLLGFYPGVFSTTPYYLKTQTYSNIESRDLWEYSLDLTQREVEQLLLHAWEMGTTHFNYYFFDENCSYHLLSLLEVARPGLKLREQFFFATIPVDSVRAALPLVTKPPRRRESSNGLFARRLELLTSEDRERFFQERKAPKLTGYESAALLDAWIEDHRLRALREASQVSENYQSTPVELLNARRRMTGVTQAPVSAPEIARPENGHRTTKLRLGQGIERSQPTTRVEFRAALHDLLDPDPGYLPFSELTVLRLSGSLRWSKHSLTEESGRFRLDDFTFGEVQNFDPISRLRIPLSWRMGAGLTRPLDRGCVSCVVGEVRSGGGFTLGHSKLIFATLFEFMPRIGPRDQRGWIQILLGPRATFGYQLHPRLKVVASGAYYFSTQDLSVGGGWLVLKDWELRAQFRKFGATTLSELSAGFYY